MQKQIKNSIIKHSSPRNLWRTNLIFPIPSYGIHILLDLQNIEVWIMQKGKNIDMVKAVKFDDANVAKICIKHIQEMQVT